VNPIMMSRRTFLTAAAAAACFPSVTAAKPEPLSALQSITGDARPITVAERLGRVAKAQRLMEDQKIGALLIESGSTLDYFTGITWWRSERTTAAILPAVGEVIVVTPAFEEPSVRETLQIGGEVRSWNEHDSPFALIVQALADRGVTSGPLAVESTVRFFIIDGIRQLSSALDIVSADKIVRACRQIKSPAELALLQIANDVTYRAMRYVHGRIRLGMTQDEVLALMNDATHALGGKGDGGLALLNEASAYPHGSHSPERVQEGGIILMDCGCTVHGYTSDISRSWVFGQPSPKQRKLWETVKRGQQLVLASATLGAPVGSIDDAVRRFYESEGWGPGYALPGLPHRAGHGIGLDGHESPYLVHGDTTPLEAGMCFSDEPGLYIPGAFGVRLEDCWVMTENGPKTFTPLAKSIDQPFL
jgi:Xaa-Pro dipeptidase